MSKCNWKEGHPTKAGVYMVGSTAGFVACARYAPRLGVWKFPSASQAFTVTHYDEMPLPPVIAPNSEDVK